MRKILSMHNDLKIQLDEMLDRYNVTDWNNYQKNIWLQLVNNNLVGINDVNTFFSFGQAFSDYFDKYKKPAPYNYIAKELGLV